MNNRPVAQNTSLPVVDTIETMVDDNWDRSRIELIKKTYCKKGTDLDLQLFISTCQRVNLSPEARQIYAVIRETRDGPVMTIQTSIDGFRLIADRSDRYEGQTEVQWCGTDGVWKSVWMAQEHPVAARVGVYKKGFREALYATAHWDEYYQSFKDGNPTQFWAKMPRLMLGKVAEALALRKAFPQELSGIYSADEINDEVAKDLGEESPKKEKPKQPIKQVPSLTAEKKTQPSLRQLLAEKGVTEQDMELFIGKSCSSFLPADHKTLRAALQELEMGKTWADLMEFAPVSMQIEAEEKS